MKQIDQAKEIWKNFKYKKYLGAAGLFAILLVILFFFTGEEYIEKRWAKINHYTVSGDRYVPDKEFEVDEYEEVNELIYTYFEAYVNADFETLSEVARPLSDMEQSYIAAITQNFEEYQGITCYTKHGLSKDSYIVAVSYEIKFEDVETPAPSLELFYIQTDENGELFINNLYSDFNRRYKEQPVNKDINTALIKFTSQDDYIDLYTSVEDEFKELIREDEEIYILTKRTIPAIRQEWEDEVLYAHEDDTEEETDYTEDGEEQTTEGGTEPATGGIAEPTPDSDPVTPQA